jgi:hypothetical protein
MWEICTRVVQFFDFVNNLRFQFILILEIKGSMVPDFWKFSETQPPVLTFEKNSAQETYGFGFMKIFKKHGCIDERTGKEPAV